MRLLALDIDHTLTGSGHRITETNARAVIQAAEAGVAVTLITGRRYTGSAAAHADHLGLTGPLGVHYGRRVVSHASGDILSNHPLPSGAALALIEAAAQHPDAIISVFAGDELLFNRLPDELVTTGFSQFGEADLPALVRARPREIMSVHISGAQCPAAAKAAGDAGTRLYPGLLDYYYSPWAGDAEGLLTAISSAADKGTALVDIARLLGVDPRDAVAMGDSVADIPMLRAAGLGVAMPWASAEVREAAGRVAEGDYEDAVARVIYEFLDRE